MVDSTTTMSSNSRKACMTASTPLAASKKPKNILNISEISNISCSEGDKSLGEADTTVTNVTVIEVTSEKPSAGKENVAPIRAKKDELVKKRKAQDMNIDVDNEIEFIENPHKSIQLNQSTTEEFLRLGSTEKEVAVGIFWDIENVRMPRGLNPAMLITKLREKFVDESSKFCEKHFYVVCDVKEESYQIMKQLFEFHVRIIHVPRLKANSSDNVIRDLMHEFVGYNKFCRIILVSGDSDFSYDIHNFTRNKKCDCILVHNKNAKESLIKSATSAHLYTDLLKVEIAKLEQKQKEIKKQTVIYKSKIDTQNRGQNGPLQSKTYNNYHDDYTSQFRWGNNPQHSHWSNQPRDRYYWS